MATLEGFIDELIAVVRSASGIKYAPDDPPASIANDPAAIVWLTDGRSVIGPPELATYHHGVRVGLITSLQDTKIANQRILPKIETVIEAIWNKLRSSSDGFDHCQNIEQITFTYGPIQWADIWYFGALIDLEDVKIQRTL
jgi:hypothetical protein